MAETQKDTLYIDIDDEITTIIDKLQRSSNKVVALVLPKRATALQSVVNMKLLKRASEQANKNLVLITTESSLMPLAGAVGLHVAKTPTSRPEIPASPVVARAAEEQVDEIDLDGEDAAAMTAANAGAQPVGDLAAASRIAPVKPQSDSGVETLQLDNTDTPTTDVFETKPVKHKKDNKLAVPDFNKFRILLGLGALLLLILIIGGYFAFTVLPKATINVKTNASNITSNVDFTLNTKTTSFNEANKIVPAKQVQSQKTVTGTAPATGQKNNGDKATGSVAMTAQECAPNISAPSIPSGTGVSTGGKTYVTQENAQFMYVNAKGSCVTYKSTNPVQIKAQVGGSSFNVDSGTAFKVSGHPDITDASGSANGGTDNIQTIVSQSDIDAAKAKITATNGTAQQDLQKQLEDQALYAITATYVASDPASNDSAAVGDQATNVTVTQTITYTMLGANLANIKSLVDVSIKQQINTSNQAILNEGITQAAFKVSAATTNGAAINLQTTGIVGPSLDTNTIARQAAGKKAGDIKAKIGSTTGVTDVEVKLSPFWVGKAPKKVSKITVTIAKPTASANDN